MRKIYKIINIALIFMIIRSDFAYSQDISTLRPSLSYSANNTGEATDRFNRAAMFQSGESIRGLFEKRADVLGGKGAWDEILEGLAEKIGFNAIPGAVRMSIQEIWADFIKQNKSLVDKGNNLIAKDIEENGKVREETRYQLRKIMRQFIFPKELEELIKSKTDKIKGKIIVRSSGKREDSFIRNLARIFSSPKRIYESLITQGVKSMLEQAINVIWIQQNSSEKPIEGVPNVLTPEEGFGALVEQFLEFDASGTAMSNYYGHTSIEAVIGDAEMAVRPVYANTSQFLFRKGTSEFEYNPSFLDTPYEFRLKGERYCSEINKGELEEAIEKYPKIKGAFSPLTEEQAIEVNRVINALEEELGVPVDVEWGYLDGKLYIVQVRPIIGDFRKPLVEKSQVLDGKESIAVTPIALGHTAREGFTGKVVLFGSNVTQEAIEKFEEETEASYIRVQHDAATKVLDGSTKAKVLVDVVQGSRQAHNIALITDRISKGEFAYANGPVLRDGLEKNLRYIPHPSLKGIWISEEDVTYFSDGLKGSFYFAGEKDKVEHKLTERQEILQSFHDRVKDIWDKKSSDFRKGIEDVFFNIIKDVIFKGEIREIYSELIFDLFSSNTPLEAVKNKIIMNKYNQEDLENLQPEIELLEEALAYPLYPHSWENRHMGKIRKLLVLKGINEALEQEKKKEEKINPDKYRVILIEAKLPEDSFAVRALERDMPGSDIVHIPISSIDDIELQLRKVGYNVSFFYAHLHGISASEIIKIFTKIRLKNPNARIFIDSLGIVMEDFDAFQKQYGKIEIFSSYITNKVLFGEIKTDFDKWQEKQENLKAKETLITEPKMPEQLVVLWIEDNSEELEGVRKKIETGFGGDKTYKFIYVSSMKGAVEKMEANKPDVAIFDIDIWSDKEYITKYRDGLKNTTNLYAVTLGSENVSSDHLNEMFENDVDRIKIIYKPQDIGMGRFGIKFDLCSYVDKIIPDLKYYRGKQIENYEKKLAEWQKNQQPEKLKMLILDDDEAILDSCKMLLDQEFGDSEEYEFHYCRTYSEALKTIEDNDINTVVLDLNMPTFDKEAVEAERLFIAKLNNIKYITLVSGIIDEESEAKINDKFGLEMVGRMKKIEKPMHIARLVKELREEQNRDTDTLSQKIAPELSYREAQFQTVFVIENSPSEAADLSEFIKEKLKEGCNVIKIDSIWSLKRELARQKPDLIITDTVLDDISERRDALQIDYILELIKNKNPEAQFIITSDIAALFSEDRLKLEGFNILGIIEKPFYFQSVLNIIQDKKPLKAPLEKEIFQRSIDSGV